MAKYVNPLDVITKDRVLPEGYDSWGIKSVGFDGRTRYGFTWPAPGEATAVYPLDDHGSSCPRREGDGLCIATTWAGMASGGYRAFCLLVVAYRSADARSDEPGKLRVPQVFVVDRIDGEAIARANLRGADLRGANLRGADLRVADLRGADLGGANLRGADLGGANLRGADIRDSDLRGADLRGANLRGAGIRDSDLRDSDLRGADLGDADLRDADLRDADLGDADLRDLRGRGAIL